MRLRRSLDPNLGYDPQKDFEPVGLIAEQPELLTVRKDIPANNLKEFVAYAKANESKLNMGHAASALCPMSAVSSSIRRSASSRPWCRSPAPRR